MENTTETEYNLVILFPINNGAIYREIKNWDIEEVLPLIKQAGNIYGFKFELRKKVIEKNSQKGRIDIDIQKVRTSGIYYLNCYVETLEDLLVKPRPNTTLLKQMQQRGIKKVVCTVKDDLIFPLLQDDVVLDKKGNLIDC